MSAFKERLRIAGGLALILLGGTVLLFYRGEEFSFLIGLGSIGVGLGFLWRLWNQSR